MMTKKLEFGDVVRNEWAEGEAAVLMFVRHTWGWLHFLTLAGEPKKFYATGESNSHFMKIGAVDLTAWRDLASKEK